VTATLDSGVTPSGRPAEADTAARGLPPLASVTARLLIGQTRLGSSPGKSDHGRDRAGGEGNEPGGRRAPERAAGSTLDPPTAELSIRSGDKRRAAPELGGALALSRRDASALRSRIASPTQRATEPLPARLRRLDAGSRSVQSYPLLAPGGEVLGGLSFHGRTAVPRVERG
jgi:hypothetical protein